ncbi:MAG: ABC transporter ATP-binding protein [Desulfurococcales archaeon]|nr:ABC transporter ATP-binding protein [Desulfurococcales archaeon]
MAKTSYKECRVSVEDLEVSMNGTRILYVNKYTVEKGLHLILGPNGAGKTTLLKVLSGILSPSKGIVTICGDKPDKIRDMIGYLPALPEVDPLATVENVIEAGLYGSSIEDESEAVEEAIQLVGISRLLGRRFTTLSSGEQRLVCAARVLARRPRILLLDELFNFLDISNKERVFRIVREYTVRNNAITLVTTHEIYYAGLFDTVTVLRRGEVMFHGRPGNLGEDVLRSAYGIDILSLRINGKTLFLPRHLVE